MLKAAQGKYDISVLDVHAEATSEKIAMSHYFDGKIDIIFGTHTHVQTADERIMPQGTGYITDLGMTGPAESVLGVKPEQSIAMFRGDMRPRFETAPGEAKLECAVFTVDTETGLCTAAEAMRRL